MYTRINDWHKITVSESDSFNSSLQVINKGGYQLALVRGDDGKLAGMVTDSDIRKALLNGVNLDSPIRKVMNTSPLIVSPNLDDNEAINLMQLNHFFHLPIVDALGMLVGVHVSPTLCTSEQRSETFVIMAGGRGKRLMPLTANVPKPMLPLQGRPILEHIINRAKYDGFSNIVISVNYLSDVITNYFGNGSNLDVKIDYIHEGKPLGTAGSLASLPDHTRSNHVVVTNADVITNVSFGDLVLQAKRDDSDGVIAVRSHEIQNPFGVVRSKGNILTGLEEKPIYRNQVNAGMYVIGPKLLELLNTNSYCDMPDLFGFGLEKGLNLQVFPLHENWIDIGRPSDYEIACEMHN
ncbi:nucleotidyltransferase family protein [Prochlorococcus sp. MIT 1306]|uniref:nucleotidyltransferase family protein n=1 Tax=Prochlorococcus sp. MIT 1306 TaxID=1799667 RepID=UPI0007B3D9CB|nr:nucleotidyltransferase family protein [Prochlorococcus sp. MIT 1306]KZR61078.1 D-glycero-alpha-D-manno-heptose 1-phosphate guanylyltransferase [Prochlorococcus sp. MIT 1306]